MLTAMRRLAGTWVAKALVLLLILSFAVWGIEDVVRNIGRETAVARVGDERIELAEAQAAVRREQQRLQRQFGGRFELTPPIREALAAQALEALVAERAQRVEARRLGIAIPPAVLRDYIFSIPGFQTAGQFDRRVVDQFMRQNELTEQGFLALVAADLEAQTLLGAVRAGVTAPEPLARPLLAWQQERRVADVVEFPLLDAAAPEPPSEAALRRFHANNPERFSAPEYREATVAVLSAAYLAAEVELSEAALREAFEQRRDQYETPERRAIEQALLPDEAAARLIADAWAGETGFAEIAARAGAAGGSALDLGLLTRDGLPFPELAAAAFALAAGGTSPPVRSPFGWHVLHVARVEPGSRRAFDAVREELRRELALERAADLVYQRANRVEDALAGGAALREVAAQFGLALATVRLDRSGRDEAGGMVPLPVPPAARAEVLTAIFDAAPGQPPRLAELPDSGFVGVEVQQVSPAALRPFETVEAEVRRAWTLEQQRRGQEERAAGLLAALRDGTPLDTAAAAIGATVVRIGPFARTVERDAPAGSTPPRELLAPLFAARLGEPTMATTQAGYAVAVLREILVPEEAAAGLGLGQVRSEIEQAMQDDLEAQFRAALRARTPVRIDRELLRRAAGN
jgi:peptidyl-prolyl cis-trans isomerase D